MMRDYSEEAGTGIGSRRTESLTGIMCRRSDGSRWNSGGSK